MAGTSSVSGLSSGIDWADIIDQLKEVEHKKIDLVESRKEVYEERLSAWQSINTKLLSLKTAADTLNEVTDFNLYTTSLSSDTTTDAEDILSVTTDTDASPGTYKIIVNSLATAQKLSSTSYDSQTTALNLSGDLIIGGRTVKVTATDSLSSLKDKINTVNTGTNPSQVTASIVNYGTSGYRLILTSDEEGSAGISLLSGGSTDLLGALGFVDASSKTAKNSITGGNESDAFSDADEAIGGSELLNLTSPQSGTVTLMINGTSQSVAINLATDSLNTVRDAINTAFSGVFTSDPASVVSETDEDGNTTYRLLIEGNSITYTDSNNVLETLGILERGGVSDEKGVTGDVANTSSGEAVTSSTLIKDIDGYNDYASGDTITLSGTSTNGDSVSTGFTFTDSTTIEDLLTEIETRYGEVTASVTADGKIRVADNEIGDTNLSVILTPSKTSLKFDQDSDLGAIATIRSRQIQAGSNANITVDGVTITPSSNTVDDVIPGVTLNLKEAASNTTVTLTVGIDDDTVIQNIEDFVTSFNETLDAINEQLAYDSENQEPGGPLFGDSALRTIKSNLTSIILDKVSVSDDFSTLGLIGISLGTDGQLTIDEDELQDNLENNFDDVKALFATNWSSTDSNLSYVYHTIDTKAGTYNINITGTNPVAGYFVNSGDATGEGEYLKGIAGDAKGLLIRYSGTATGTIGSFSLTFGVAELLDRSLYHITDSGSGTITNKEETLQNTIDNLEEDMETMEARLVKKMEELESRFVAMEMALSKIKSQSDWLTSMFSSFE
jgi:flagellar hook-associated protein 2